MTVRDIPFGFDADFYRGHYPDLAQLPDVAAWDHFITYGIAEGRQGSATGCRSGFVERIGQAGLTLEIGPFCNPTVRGPDVRYLDMLDATQLRERAVQLDLDPAGCPETIHYLGDIAGIRDQFDAVLSSHAIEHQPDLIHHLLNVARILKPGGKYFLFVPDKRYCFDHFIPESTIADVILTHRERPTVHSLRSLIEHHALNTHNNCTLHWAGEHGERRPANQDMRIDEAIENHKASRGGYIDVHAWYFTPVNFWDIFSSLHARKTVPLRMAEIYPTLRDTNEFFAVLEKV